MISKKLIIVGAGGHGKVIADIALNMKYSDIEFLDDNTAIISCMGFPVSGKVSEANKNLDADFIVAIGDSSIREKVQRNLEEKNFEIKTLKHPKAVIGNDVIIGKGSVVMAGAVINSGTVIGKGCIVNTGATIDHDNMIGDFVHISVGAHLAGNVKIGRSTWIGAGAIISNNIEVCENVLIGAGAVVIKDIVEPGTYVGVPARKKESKSIHHIGKV